MRSVLAFATLLAACLALARAEEKADDAVLVGSQEDDPDDDDGVAEDPNSQEEDNSDDVRLADEADAAGRRRRRRCYKGVAVKRRPGGFLPGHKVPGGQDGGTQNDLPAGAPVLVRIHPHMQRRGSRMFYTDLGPREKLVLKCCGPRGFYRRRSSCVRESDRSGGKDFKFCKFFIMVPCCSPCTNTENEELNNLMDDVDGLVLPYPKVCAPRLVHHGNEQAPMQLYQVIVRAGDQVKIGPVGPGAYFHDIVVIGRQYNWIHKVRKIVATFFQYEEDYEAADPDGQVAMYEKEPKCWLPYFLRKAPLPGPVRLLLCLIWWIIKMILKKLFFWCKFIGPSNIPPGGGCHCPVYDYYPMLT